MNLKQLCHVASDVDILFEPPAGILDEKREQIRFIVWRPSKLFEIRLSACV